MSKRPLTIDVYSDVICPWCYIGKRRLDRALDQVKASAEVAITWRPFQLNPTMPKEGMDRATYLEAKFGSLDAFRRMEERMLAAGAFEHVAFAMGKIARTPNTFLAHRLIWYGAKLGHQDAVVESLFRGYFERGADIGSQRTLTHLANQAGLDEKEVERFLASDEGEAEVKGEEVEGHRLGIRGVPYFLLNQTHGISGAQPVEAFVSAINALQSRASLPAKASSGRR